MSVTAEQTEVAKAAERDIPNEDFVRSPGEWKDEISIALVDAVYSGQNRYLSDTLGKGVYNRVVAFSEEYTEVETVSKSWSIWTIRLSGDSWATTR